MFAGPARNATGFFIVFGVTCREETRGPLPYVAGHVVEPVAIGGKSPDRRSALVAIGLEVLPRKPALPGVGHGATLRSNLFTPRVSRAFQATAGSKFPFGFGRQRLSRPVSVGAGILVSDVDYRVVSAAVEGAVRTLGMPPIRAGCVFPPGTIVTQTDRAARLPEHQRTGHQQCRIGVRVRGGIGRTLGEGDVSGRGHELRELRTGHRMRLYPESIDRLAANRALLGVEIVRTHEEAAAPHPDHVAPARSISHAVRLRPATATDRGAFRDGGICRG